MAAPPPVMSPNRLVLPPKTTKEVKQMDIVDEFKKGYRTSEFWIVAVTAVAPVVTLVLGVELDVEQVVMMIGSIFGAIGWATNRTFLKRKRIEAVSGPTG
jgi:hypothetical protein